MVRHVHMSLELRGEEKRKGVSPSSLLCFKDGRRETMGTHSDPDAAVMVVAGVRGERLRRLVLQSESGALVLSDLSSCSFFFFFVGCEGFQRWD